MTSTHSKLPPIIIQVPRNEVEELKVGGAIAVLDSWVPELLERNRNRVQFEVLGYGEDSRELYDIPEVRGYYARLFERTNSLLYWIDIDSYMFVLLGLMLYEPQRIGRQVTLRPFHLQAFLQRAFARLNSFCEEWQLSPEPTTILVRRAISGEAR